MANDAEQLQDSAPRERLRSAFFDVGMTEAVARLIAFGGSLYVARTLGSDSYGVVALALAIQLYLTKVTDLGVEATGARLIAASPNSIEQTATALTGARLAASLLAILLLGGAYTLFADEPHRGVLLLYLFVLIPMALSPRWILIGMQRSKRVGMARIAAEVLGFLLLLLWVRSPTDIWVPPVVLLICECVVVACLASELGREHRLWPALRNGFEAAAATRMLRQTLPGLGYAFALLLLYNADIVLIGVFENAEAVGGYAVAYALISFLGNLAVSYGAVLLPVLTQLVPGSDKEKETYQGVALMLLATSLPAALGGAYLAEDIILMVYGANYHHAAGPLALLFLSLLFNVIRKAPAAALIARGHQRRLMNTTFVAAGLNVTANLILIPIFGIAGAAVATLGAELVLATATFALASKLVVATPTWFRGIRALAASLLMIAGVSMVLAWVGDDGRSLTRVLVGSVSGIVFYGTSMTLMGAMRISRKGLHFTL